jgi:uncharacterized protein (TIGR04255 family)
MSDQRSSAKHPRSTIIEALCEIHFALPEGQPWSPAIPGRFFRRIQDDFPEMEADQVMAVDVMVGPSGQEETSLRPRLRTRFRHRQRPLVVQLSEGILTVNVLEPYAGWHKLRSDVVNSWTEVLSEIKPATIERVGMRYINRFPRQDRGERASLWLRPGEYLATGALSALPGSLSRVEAHLAESEQMIVTLRYQPPAEVPTHGAFVFDIDRISLQRHSVNPEVLAASIDQLHADIGRAFAASASDYLEHYLRGGNR